jgi:hypothetical protein
MPLRDHFRSPLADRKPWEAFHTAWPTVIVGLLNRYLPRRYEAEPGVHIGSSAEIDVSTFEDDEPDDFSSTPGNGDGGVATAVWAPPRPTLSISTDFPSQDEYEVRVYDMKLGRQLVAAIEIVSPSNKDRPDHRRAFVAKCAALLQERVSVTIVDLVTSRAFNLYQDLLELIGEANGSPEPEALYAAACRATKQGERWLLEAWAETLTVGQPLPTLPLWLADNLSVPLRLEESYEETCRVLRIV